MKAIVVSLTVALIAGAVTSCLGPQMAGVPGGFSSSSVTSVSVIDAATFAVAAESKKVHAKVDLIKIVAAEQQVVAGWNYVLTLKVRMNGREQMAQATVWHQAWRKPDPYQLTDWLWK